MSAADRHRETPISIRLPKDDRAWLESYARQAGRPVRAVIVEAIARERARQEGRTMDTAIRLTAADRDNIARARELAALSGEEIRGQSGYDEPSMALADFAGRAQQLLFELAAIIDRFDGHAAAQVTAPGDD